MVNYRKLLVKQIDVEKLLNMKGIGGSTKNLKNEHKKLFAIKPEAIIVQDIHLSIEGFIKAATSIEKTVKYDKQLFCIKRAKHF